MAGYVIHTPVGLNQREMAEADELGPSEAAVDVLHADLARSVGFSVVRNDDVTTDFRATCDSMLRARTEHAEALRVEEGPDAFEDEQEKKRGVLLGIDRGLLVRSLIVVEKA